VETGRALHAALHAARPAAAGSRAGCSPGRELDNEADEVLEEDAAAAVKVHVVGQPDQVPCGYHLPGRAATERG
jgi:hypothetical protein